MTEHSPTTTVTEDSPLPAAGFDAAQVPAYYSRKTAEIVHKYGPGPRVHFHVGLFNPGPPPQTTVPQRVLRRRLIDSQEEVLAHAARLWGMPENPPETLLDVGAGLGGGSIYYAQTCQSKVTALTVTPEHIPLITEFAEQAQVSDKVTALLGDIHELTHDRAYDAAIAFESSGYMDRRRLFAVAAQALRPGGWFGIQEHLSCHPDWRDFLDRSYKTRLGTLEEYITAARAAGFELEHDQDITDRVTEFWMHSQAWTTAELEATSKNGATSPISRNRLIEQALTHGTLYRVWRDHAVETHQLLFRLEHRHAT
ncbi:methyltransferase domain-containing protein [Streptomyces sp. NPDC006863]|uniref:SAM-dependent methyltransferase n=1 Tax=unclassified Streptomyces TaxID=2593676 RepID=UPI0033D0B6B8